MITQLHRRASALLLRTAAALVAFGIASTAGAGVLSFGTAAGDLSGEISFVNNQGITGDNFVVNCTGCVAATSPSAAAGTYNLSLNTFGDFGPTTFLPSPNPLNAALPPGIYSEQYGGTLSLSVSGTNGTLIAGSCAVFTIFAQPGASNAVFQCQISNPSSTLVTLPTGAPLYLIVSGTTPNPVSIVSVCIPSLQSSAQCGTQAIPITSFGGMTLDWSATVSTAPYSPQSFVTVPNVVNASQASAATQMFNAGLNEETVATQASTTVPAGSVISQSPAAGTSVPAGWPFDLLVSSGPPGVAVPNVLGSTESAAISALQAAGLTVTTVTLVPSTASLAGTVSASTPTAGTTVASGSAVALTVNGGPAAPPALVNFKGDGTSSFKYSMYSSSATFVEAFIQSSENNAASIYSIYVYGAGAFDGAGNPLMFQLSYADATTPVTCGTSGCDQPINGGGTLTIFAVSTCSLSGGQPNIGLGTCDWTQGTLGAGAIYAGSSLAALAGNSVNQATLALAYTPTASFAVASGITTNLSQAAQGYLIISGASVTNSPGTAPAATTVQPCYLDPDGYQCGPLGGSDFAGAYSFGPYYSPFGIDWTGSISPTAYAASSSSVTVPSLVGDTQAAAAAALATAGLVVGQVTTQTSATVPDGLVVSQSPSANASAADGSSVNFVVSTGPAPVSVPNVLGDTQAVAASVFTTAGLVLGTVTTQASTSVALGSVISQDPVAATSVPAGSAVNLVVSSGPLRGDINGDGEVDTLDLALITAVLNKPASGPNDPRDLNHDGVINALDARILVTLCTHPGCAHE